MTREIITISDNGRIAVPDNVKMNIAEIADLLGLYYQTTKKAIREIEKSNIIQGDFTIGGVVENSKIYPDYYGLDMIIAVAFRVNTCEADIFRRWIFNRLAKSSMQPIYIGVSAMKANDNFYS